MAKKRIISTTAAPAAVGPYSQAVEAPSGRTLYISGQIPLDPATGTMPEGIEKQTEQVFANADVAAGAAGALDAAGPHAVVTSRLANTSKMIIE